MKAVVNSMGRAIKVATGGRIRAIRFRLYGLRQVVLRSICVIELDATSSRVTRGVVVECDNGSS